MSDLWNSVGTKISKTPVLENMTYRVIILSVAASCLLLYHITLPDQTTAHKGVAGPAINDQR